MTETPVVPSAAHPTAAAAEKPVTETTDEFVNNYLVIGTHAEAPAELLLIGLRELRHHDLIVGQSSLDRASQSSSAVS